MSLVQGNEIGIEEFSTDEDSGGVVVSEKGVKILVSKLEKKMRASMNYLDYLASPVTFRRSIWFQVRSLAHCIDREKLEEYQPLRIR